MKMENPHSFVAIALAAEFRIFAVAATYPEKEAAALLGKRAAGWRRRLEYCLVAQLRLCSGYLVSGSVPATNSCQLLAPSPSGSAPACES